MCSLGSLPLKDLPWKLNEEDLRKTNQCIELWKKIKAKGVSQDLSNIKPYQVRQDASKVRPTVECLIEVLKNPMVLLFLRHIAIITQTILLEYPDTCFSFDLQVVLVWDCNKHDDVVSITQSTTSQFAKVYGLARFLTLCSGDFTSYRDTLALLRYVTWCSHISGAESCIDPCCVEAETSCQNNHRKKHHAMIDGRQDPPCDEERKCFRPKNIVTYTQGRGGQEGHSRHHKFNLTSLDKNDLGKYADWIRGALRIAFHTSHTSRTGLAQQDRPPQTGVELSAEPGQADENADTSDDIVSEVSGAKQQDQEDESDSDDEDGGPLSVTDKRTRKTGLVNDDLKHEPQDWSYIGPGSAEHVDVVEQIASRLQQHRFRSTQGLYSRGASFFTCFDCPHLRGWPAVTPFLAHFDYVHKISMGRFKESFRPLVCDWCDESYVSTASMANHLHSCSVLLGSKKRANVK
ncbi:hypothetical protein ONS95_009635 [Cadophora gregata]|nr:uncharacterized protein ONS95_009635 [Cadophora gregata]KAK0124691.1 hypothetical protein ONS95_009635 [Cadophora gregata]